MEPLACFSESTDKNIRPDLRLYNPGPLVGVNNNNCDVIIDVRVSDPVCNSHLRGDAIGKAEREKENKYQSHADVANLCFIPMIFESFGRISKKAKTLVKALVKRIYEQDPEQVTESRELHYWNKRISASLQRSQAEVMLYRYYRVMSGVNGTECAYDDSIVSSVSSDIAV